MKTIAIEISWCGAWEEFHQKRGEVTLYEFWKNRRLNYQYLYNQLRSLNTARY